MVPDRIGKVTGLDQNRNRFGSVVELVGNTADCTGEMVNPTPPSISRCDTPNQYRGEGDRYSERGGKIISSWLSLDGIVVMRENLRDAHCPPVRKTGPKLDAPHVNYAHSLQTRMHYRILGCFFKKSILDFLM